MSETFDATLIKANRGKRSTQRKNTQLQFSGKAEDYLGSGAYGFVTRVSMPIAGERYLGLAYKKTSEGYAANALRAWVGLKNAGLPVPETFRLVECDGVYTGILMTDLTNGWRDILISSNETNGTTIDRVNKFNPSVVKMLAAEDIKAPDFKRKIETQINAIAEKAAKNKIEFGHRDVVSAVYSYTGKLGLIISDMDNVFLASNMPEAALMTNDKNKAKGINLPIAEAHRIAKEVSQNRF